MENIPHDGDGRNQRLGAPNPDNIPDELKSGRFWLVWRYERGTKIPKIASTTTIQAASSTNSDTWRTFDEAMAAYKTGHFSGIGRVIVEGHGLTGLDIDKCINPETGEFDPHAEDVIRFFCSFSEISPSLTGVKIWVKGELPRSYKKAGLEVYNGGRFFTVTGRSLPWTPQTVETRQDELDAFIPAEFPRPAKRSSGPRGIGVKSDLEKFLEAAGVTILKELHDGSADVKYGIVCPWVDEHSTAPNGSDTRVGQYPDGATWFRCEHSHCEDRGWAEFRDQVDPRIKGFKRNVTIYRSPRKVAI